MKKYSIKGQDVEILPETEMRERSDAIERHLLGEGPEVGVDGVRWKDNPANPSNLDYSYVSARGGQVDILESECETTGNQEMKNKERGKQHESETVNKGLYLTIDGEIDYHRDTEVSENTEKMVKLLTLKLLPSNMRSGFGK